MQDAWRIPESFCWTRFGVESGETVAEIVIRKETERKSNGGIFLWGVGNALGNAIEELVKRSEAPEVLFSPIRGAPRSIDIAPPSVFSWTAAETLDGEPFGLPAGSRVLSRAPEGRRSHYALVCGGTQPIEIDPDGDTLRVAELRNLLSGKRVGASQVTAVVSRVADSAHEGSTYPVAFRASLIHPYFVKLAAPRLVV